MARVQAAVLDTRMMAIEASLVRRIWSESLGYGWFCCFELRVQRTQSPWTDPSATSLQLLATLATERECYCSQVPAKILCDLSP